MIIATAWHKMASPIKQTNLLFMCGSHHINAIFDWIPGRKARCFEMIENTIWYARKHGEWMRMTFYLTRPTQTKGAWNVEVQEVFTCANYSKIMVRLSQQSPKNDLSHLHSPVVKIHWRMMVTKDIGTANVKHNLCPGQGRQDQIIRDHQ